MGIWRSAQRRSPGVWPSSLFLPDFRAQLASTMAEKQQQDLEKTRQYSQELRVLTEQLHSLTLFLQTKLKEKVGSGVSFSSLTIVSISSNKDGFTSSFLNCIPFISFSCLTVLARTSPIVLKRNGERGHPCLVPDLKGKALSFSPLSMMLTVGFL